MVFSGRERGETSRTGPINLEMIGRMKLELMMIGMWKIWRTARNRLWQLRSFGGSTESLRAFMTKDERKSMFYRYLEVSKMCQLAERKRGSKSRILLLAHSC